MWRNGNRTGLDPAGRPLKRVDRGMTDLGIRVMRVVAFLLMMTPALLPGAALAQNAPELVQTFSAWEAYRYEGDGQVTCYLLSKPTKMEPQRLNHGDVFFFLTTRPGEAVENEASVMVGYPFATDSQVTVTVDGKSFRMFTKEDSAWVESTAEEQQLVAAMKAGSNMTVSGRSERGNETTYTFSLSGVTAGSNSISNGCRGA